MDFLSKSVECGVVRKFQGVSGFYVRFSRLTKFCFVGGSGVVVDTAVLALLTDPRFFGWNIAGSKFCAAASAMLNNFIWNELWTFQYNASARTALPGWDDGSSPLWCDILRRFVLFNAICGIGITLAVFLLHFFHSWLGWNLYLSNLLAVIVVTGWNFGMNTRFNWRRAKACN